MDVQYAILRAANHQFMRRAARLANRIVRFRKPRSVRSDGYEFYVQSLDRWASLWLRRLTRAEQFETKLWAETVKPGMIVADVGANLGLYSIIAAHRVGNEGEVHSFEPHPDTFRLLGLNLQRNDASHVQTHRTAIADRTGEIQFFVRPEHQGDHRIFRPDDTKGLQTITVPVTTLGEVFGSSGRLDLVKFDIQGAEHLAWGGMQRIVDANPHIIIFAEFFPEGLVQSGSSPEAFLDDVKAAGFSIGNINDDAQSVDQMSPDELLNMVAKTRYTNLLLRRESAVASTASSSSAEAISTQ